MWTNTNYIWDKVNFWATVFKKFELKAVFHKFYLVHS